MLKYVQMSSTGNELANDDMDKFNANHDERWRFAVAESSGGAAQESKGEILLAATTTNFKYACGVLQLNPIEASDALHAAKKTLNLGGADNCDFDLATGDILYNGESIGNLGDK